MIQWTEHGENCLLVNHVIVCFHSLSFRSCVSLFASGIFFSGVLIGLILYFNKSSSVFFVVNRFEMLNVIW